MTGSIGPIGPQGALGTTGAAGPQGVAGARGPAGSLFGEDAAVFAGFTATPMTGGAGSREAMHASCAAAFAGSHLCHVAEYFLADSATPVPAAGAWIDASATVDGFVDLGTREAGRYTAGAFAFTDPHENCNHWTMSSSSWESLTLVPAGTSSATCDTVHTLACCSTPYRERFRGFTTTTTTGAAGGLAQMHALCGEQFPSSHLCHSAEYSRATPTIVPPATGAWIDASAYFGPAGLVDVSAIATTRAGRSIGGGCHGWTTSNAAWTALTTGPNGATTTVCSTAHSLACCD